MNRLTVALGIVAFALVLLAAAILMDWGNRIAGVVPDYGRLATDPEALPWEQGGEHVLWTATNLPGVELRIRGLDNGTPAEPALGLGAFRLRSDAAVLELARGPGCDADYNPGNEVTVDDNGTPDDPSDDTVENYDAVWLEAGAGVGIVACEDSAATPAGTEGVIEVYTGPAPDGKALVSYTVSVGVASATPPALTPPSFSSGYQTRWVCTDLMNTRTDYFDGNEVVQGGAVTATGAADYELAPSSDRSVDHAFFSVDTTGELSVSALGADNLYGLEEGLYVVDVVATNTAGEDRAQIVIRVVLGDNAARNGSGCTL